MSIHSRIKERRIAMGLKSHQALADLIGVSWQTVQLWEKEGGTAPKRDRIDAVAKALGVTVEWLRSGSESMGIIDSDQRRKLRAVDPSAQESSDLNDAAKLLAEFAKSTPAARLFILEMAINAEKISAIRDNSSTGD